MYLSISRSARMRCITFRKRKVVLELTRYSVNLPLKEIQELKKEGRILEPVEGIFMQSLDDDTLYQAGLGLVADSVKSFATYIWCITFRKRKVVLGLITFIVLLSPLHLQVFPVSQAFPDIKHSLQTGVRSKSAFLLLL